MASRHADDLGALRARDRHERPVQGLRPARAANRVGRRAADVIDELWGIHDYTTIAPGAVNDRLARVRAGAGAPRAAGQDARHLRTNYPWCVAGSSAAPPSDHVPPEGRRDHVRPIRYADRFDRLDGAAARRASVLVVPGDHFEMDGYLRIGFGCDPELPLPALERVGEVLDAIEAPDTASPRMRLTWRSSASATSAVDSPTLLDERGRRLARRLRSRLPHRRHRDTTARRGVRGRRLDAAALRRVDEAASPNRASEAEASRQRRRFDDRAARRERRAASGDGRNDDVGSATVSPPSDTSKPRSTAGCHAMTANKGPVAFAYRACATRRARRRVVPVRRRGHGRRADLQSGPRDDARARPFGLPRRRQQHDQPHPAARSRTARSLRRRWRACRPKASPKPIRRSTSTAGTPRRRRRRSPTC